jgi:hypothetical protein
VSNLYDCDDIPNRRDIPEGSGALACVGFSWETIIEHLSSAIGDAAPEVRKRSTMWLVRARPNGIRIEFFDNEDALAKRLEQAASIKDGPQVHAGRLHWM